MLWFRCKAFHYMFLFLTTFQPCSSFMSNGQAFVFRVDPNFQFLHCLRSAMHEKRSILLPLRMKKYANDMKILHNEIEMAHACNREWKCVQSFLSGEIWINSYFAHFAMHSISMDRCNLSAAGQDKAQLTWDQFMNKLLK